MKPIAVYNGVNMKRLAYLQNAYNIKYTQHTVALWTASFSLPPSDDKRVFCQSFNLVELWDLDQSGKDRYVGLFRIMPQIDDSIGMGGGAVYELEHVFGTLLDDVMLGWHEVGNVGTYTNQAISYILTKQSVTKWIMGECDFSHQFLYGWQDENLLSALYSVVSPFANNDYFWTFDTITFPWRLNLKKIDPTPKTDIRYRKNLSKFKKITDPSNLTTRLYCYGYGDGDNKLDIKKVNGGIPYLDSPNISKYGIITQVWTDERFTVAESLKANGEAMLRKLEEPEVTYEIDIYTIDAVAGLTIGDSIRVVNGALDEYMVVRQFDKNDVSGAPKDGKIMLGNGTRDIGSSIADVSERQRISETYSQGSESIFMDSLYDNADNANPMETTFTIPSNAVHVNEIRFSAKLTNFRAYSKATQGGGATTQTSTAGGSSEQTSSAGGGGNMTSNSGGGGAVTSNSGGGGAVTSNSGGGVSSTSDSGGGAVTSSGRAWSVASFATAGIKSRTATTTSANMTGGSGSYTTNSGGNGDTGSASGTGSHKHSISSHTHTISIKIPDHAHTIGVGDHEHFYALPEHTHVIEVPSHYHGIYIPNHSHAITIPNHSHAISLPDHAHVVNLPDHTHRVNIPSHTHEITLPNHTHAIEYGIYRGPIASQMAIYLDSVLIGAYTSSVKDLNLVSYMSKNANGNVMRGEHTIKIVPSSLTRIECSYQIRMFTNARGNGQY